MSFRFWRRIRIAPGITLNLSKSTASLSLGPRGAKYTISPRGNRATAGLPGTGLFYTVHDRQRAGRGGAAPAPKVPQRDRLKLGFLQRLMTPAEERRFIDGIRARCGKDFMLGVRAAAWVVTLFGPLLIGRLRRFGSLLPNERADVLEGLAHHRLYLVRELPMLLKMVASLGYVGVPEVQRAIGLAVVDDTPPAWATSTTGGSSGGAGGASPGSSGAAASSAREATL